MLSHSAALIFVLACAVFKYQNLISYHIKYGWKARGSDRFNPNRFERCFVAAIEALAFAFLKLEPDEMGDLALAQAYHPHLLLVPGCFSPEARPSFAVEVKPFKQRFLRASLWEESCLFEDCVFVVVAYHWLASVIFCRGAHTNMRPCGYQDIRHINDSENRKCVIHGGNCDLPERLFAFGAGFSCTSFSPLNNESSSNTTAVQDDKAGSVDQLRSNQTQEKCLARLWHPWTRSKDVWK